MRQLLRIAVATALGLAALGLGPRARADIVGPFSGSVSQLPTDFTTTLTVPKFNTALGTLTEVDLSFSTSGVASGTVKNNAIGPQDFTVSETVVIRLRNGTTTLLTTSLNATQDFAQLNPGATGTFGPFSPAATAAPSAVYTSGPNFDLFNGGPGNATLTFSTLTSIVISGGGGNIQSNITTTAGGTATVSYVYTAVPEPASVVLVGLGGVLGLASRRALRRRAA